MALVVDFLHEIGISVEGIASFYGKDIRGISSLLEKQGRPPVREVIFFHSIGDLQYACHNQTMYKDDVVLFNSGSLFSSKFPIEKLREYKIKYQFKVGMYTQEFSVDPNTIKLIVSHVNDNLDLYDLNL